MFNTLIFTMPYRSARINTARSDKPSDTSRSIPDSARSTARAGMGSARDEALGSSRSNVPNSSRSNVPSSSRSNNPATMDTCRTYMDTGRVHTALAALGAEKQALLAKLQMIDAALETGEKKKASQPRPRK